MDSTPDLAAVLPEAAALGARLFDDLLAATRDPAGGVTRASYGEGEQAAHAIVARQARAMALEVSQDAALNTYLTWPGADRSAPRLVIGSHLDSVRCGGNFDGAAGVVAGLSAVRLLQQSGWRPPADVTVMGVRAEESAWFQTSYIGSRAALGRLGTAALQARRVDTGRTLAEHLRECGGEPDRLHGRPPHLHPGNVCAYLEVHIEQAPALVHAGRPLAVGAGIPGNFRHPWVRIVGETAHVGLARRYRSDALVAACALIAELDALWARWEAAGRAMAFTVGRLHTDAGNDAMTKVAGEVGLSLDMRAWDPADLDELEHELSVIARAVSERYRVRFEWGERTTAPVARCAPAIQAELRDCTRRTGAAGPDLPSPASHDAAEFAAAGIPMGLLLIRNEHGSHNPAESLAPSDFQHAVQVLTLWLMHTRCWTNWSSP
ncbi:MAG: hydantoinase/carbamoylase family amidase [Lautropia sp.]